MKIQNISSRLRWISVAVVLSCLVGFGVKNSIVNVKAQKKEKNISLAYSHNPQLKFTDVKVKKQDQKFTESFDAEPDWVKEISFNLENVSDKSIVYLMVNVNFPETRSTGNLMSYGVSFGQRPDSNFNAKNKPLFLKSGETLKVSLDKEKDRIYKFVNERQFIETIQKVELEIGFIIFEDKTAWVAGSFMRQDLDNPSIYRPIESDSSQKNEKN